MPSSNRMGSHPVKRLHKGSGSMEDISDEDFSWTPGGSERSPTKATWEINMGRGEREHVRTPPPLLPYSRPVPQWMVEEAACTLTPTTPDAHQGLTSSPLTANTHSIIDSVDNQLTTDMLSDDQTPPTTPKSYVHGLMELQALESEERTHLEDQVATRKKFLHSLITSTTSLGSLKVLLPDTLWNHDYLRLALIFAVLRGSVDVVRFIVTSGFRGYHTLRVASGYLPSKLFADYGVRNLEGIESFLQLAVMQLVCDMEEGCYSGENGASLRQNREEIFKLLVTARGVCCLEGDAEAMEQGAHLCGVLAHWKDEVKNISCLRKGCSRDTRRALTWTPSSMNMFPATFKKRAASICRVGAAKGLPKALVEALVAYTPYADNGGKCDPSDPLKKTVADVIDGHVVSFDGSAEVMKQYSQHCKGSPPVPGLRVVATITTMRGPQCMTGHITGVHDDLLYWRPLNASSSEPLTGVFFLNPLANQADLDIKGDCWLCGMCMLLNSKSMEKCRRCYNTHQGALTLEGQRKKQNVNGASLRQAQKVKQTAAMHYQRQPVWTPPYYDRYLQPFTAINLSAMPPRHEVFETADVRLVPFRVHSGQMVCASGTSGVVVGVGKDEALYWMPDGAPGVSRLAVTPEALQGVLQH